QKMSEDPLTECVECGAPVRKVLQPVGIAFKGSGFYSTDYKNGSKKSEAAVKSNGDSKAGSSDTSSAKSGSTTTEKTTKKD
ncbi:MAG TPA: hypothetical protein VHM16_02185, partial [Rubrobacteraceae bacterium]|nr:hypothetical protein [Rubrobacteraceae bacterium]